MSASTRFLALVFTTALAAACGSKAPAPAEPTPTPAVDDGQVDCERIDDAAYRDELTARGIEPDSIECGEQEDRGAAPPTVNCDRIDDAAYRSELIEQGLDPDSLDCGEQEDGAPDDLDE